MNSNKIRVFNYLNKKVNYAVIIELFERNIFNSMASFYKPVACFEENGSLYISNGRVIYIISPVIVSNENGYSEHNEIVEGQFAGERLWIKAIIGVSFTGKECYKSSVYEMSEFITPKNKNKSFEARRKVRIANSNTFSEEAKGVSRIDMSKRNYCNLGVCLTMKGNY